MKKTVIVTMLLIFALCMCAFAVVPSMELKSSNGDVIDVSYPITTTLSEDTITLYADYESYGVGFEIIKDIVVSTDSNFENIISIDECVIEDNGMYKYTLTVEDPIDRIFIAPPILYMPTTINESYTNLNTYKNQDSIMTSNVSDEDLWFTVENVTLVEVDKAVTSNEIRSDTIKMGQMESSVVPGICVNVSGNNGNLIPRFPKLIANGMEYGGLSSITFDNEMNFKEGAFVFLMSDYNVSTVNDLESAKIVVSDAMIKVDSSEVAFESDNVIINVISE